MRCEIPHRCVRRKYRIRRHSPFRLRNCWEGRSVRASSLLRQLAKGGCAARRLSWVTPGFSQSRRCKTTASAKLLLINQSRVRAAVFNQQGAGIRIFGNRRFTRCLVCHTVATRFRAMAFLMTRAMNNAQTFRQKQCFQQGQNLVFVFDFFAFAGQRPRRR